jgi:hypothetical protein
MVLSNSERAKMDVGVDAVKGFLFRQSRHPRIHLFHCLSSPGTTGVLLSTTH